MSTPSQRAPTRPALPRISTGNAELDAILRGGFPANSVNIIMGEPGSGKTILAERLMFANAESAERPILYLTTLSEPVEKLVHYLQQFSFFDQEQLLSGAILYESIGGDLKERGIEALIPKLKEIIKTLSPKIIIIDSFKAIHDLSTSITELRRTLYEVSGLLTAYDTTAFLIGEYNESMIASLPEFAIADGMLELVRQKEGLRDQRYLRVLKLRGSGYQEGLHAFRVTSRGLDVFPRLTSPEIPADYTSNPVRVPTGSKSLDALFEGGLVAGSSTLVQGPTGTGKTTLALQFALEGIARGEQVLYVSFQENPTQLARQIASLGWDLEDVERKGLHRLYTSPVELQIDSILVDLFRIIEERGTTRVVIDALGDLVAAAGDSQRLLNYLYALAQHFVVRGVTSVLTMETVGVVPGNHVFAGQMSALSDIIVTLGMERAGDRSRRTLQITKARGTAHDLDVHELCITTKGVEVS